MTHSGDRAAILVVDDNQQNRALVEATLEDEAYRVVSVASGTEALEAFEAEPFGCVLLDVRMPGMDGFEVCRRIRAHARGADTSIVFLTASRDVDTFDEALRTGGDDFLTKPLRPAELVVRVQAALELRRLSAENRGYYATLRDQRDAMIRLQLQKEQLTAFLVHDLKNPVNALDMHAQLLLRDRSLSDKGRESARAIRQEARRLIELITTMLDISKGQEAELALQRSPVDLPGLARDLLDEFSGRAKAKQLMLTASIEVASVHADPGLLRRMLANLLDNAVRHAPAGSAVSVAATSGQGVVQLCVADRGVGVPEPLREAIFQRFVQAGGDRQAGTYGLGLAFCRLVATAHGGTIHVEDGAPGAVFCVRLPQ